MIIIKNISSKYAQDIIVVFKEYREDKNLTSLRDKITNFMYKHTSEFNGLHEVKTNVCIDEFDELVKYFLIRMTCFIAHTLSLLHQARNL